MKFITLGSSSAGNGYLLRASDGETLIIEAGVKLMDVKKALNFDLSDVIGCIVSHSHNDHSGHIEEYQRAGINCYMNDATRQSKFGEHLFYNVNILKEKTIYEIGSFKVQPISLKHDVPNFGYLINHMESGLFCFITDTHYCPYKFPGMNNILVECNYSDAILERNIQNGKANMYVRNRVIKSHMELDTTIGFLRANDLSRVNNIVLLHLSDGNSDSAGFKKQIAELTGKSVFVAEPGLSIEFNKTSF
jgi:phosphoribosyl 1,2-cyclic phosphodiesterase